MNLQISCQVAGNTEYIELFGTDSLTMDISYAEIQDITKKNSSYSKEFNVPGSNNNNYVFNYFFDLNQIPLNFTPTKKFEAQLLYNGYIIQSGYIRLNSVNVVKEQKTYNITFYNGIGDVVSQISDKFLYQLDLSSLSHPWSFDVIKQSTLDPNLFPLTSTTNYSYQNGKTYWSVFNIGYEYSANSQTQIDYTLTPLVEFSSQGLNFTGGTNPNFFDYTGATKSPVNDFYFKPSIQIKELYKTIFSEAGYQVESSFFNTNYFEKLYLPLKFQDSIYNVNGTRLCYNFTNSGYTVNTCSPSTFTNLNPGSGITCNNFNLSTSGRSIVFPTNLLGQYRVSVSWNITVSATCSVSSADISGQFGAWRIENLTGAPINRVFTSDPAIINITSAINPYELYIRGRGSFKVNSITLTFESVIPFLTTGTTIDYALEFTNTEYKQIDFITSVNKAFNLVCVPHKTKPNTIVIEPVIDYIGKGRVLDWTAQIDWDSPMNIFPTTNILNGSLSYNLREDQDYTNQQFRTKNNRTFGTDIVQLNQDYKDQSIVFDSLFSPCIDLTVNANQISQITQPNLSSIGVVNLSGLTYQTFKPIKNLPKMIFRGATLPNDNYGDTQQSGATPLSIWYAAQYRQQNITSFDRWTSNNRFTTYPFSYTGFSHYINWKSSDNYDPDEFDFPSQQDLYDIYYYDYVSDIISPENKLLQAKIYLTPYEIADLEFNEKILIRNSYWRINKISGYNLTEPSLCNIELIKLTKDYTPHPVKYFDLISCTGGTDYHTTSDLNYNMYAYVGNYVNIFTGATTAYTSIGCFQVVEGTPNGNYDYEQVFIGSGYTSSGVAVYDNCNCTGRTAFDIVQQNY